MGNKKPIIIILVLLLIPVLLVVFVPGLSCKFTPKDIKEKMRPITLNYWRVWDGPDAFEEIIAKYNAMHPFIKIEYKKLRYDEYEQALLEAFATDRGPDIFSIHNTWIKKYQEKGLIHPMPDTITMVYPITTGNIKKETTLEMRTKKSLTLKELKNNFVDTVTDDAIINIQENESMIPKIYGLPLSVDTLAMFYNKDLFNNASISAPSEYWNSKFQDDVKKLNKQNNRGEIIQSGISLGGSDNIERSFDILSILMMQSGAEMLSPSGIVKFHVLPEELSANQSSSPGLQALRFYTDFANAGKEVYSWNSQLDNSLDLFAKGKLAMTFGYSYHLPQIRAMAPKLNFAVTKLPQIEKSAKINYANYWVESVSSKILTNPENLKQGSGYAKNKLDAAWDFVQFATAEEQVESYLNITKKPTALRALIDKQTEDLEVGIFADQILTAKSWYHGKDANAAETIIKEMIDMAVADPEKIGDALEIGAQKTQQTIK